ncbi:general secretion pathway protein GspD [Mucilaginibacter sp. RS28]|uniref:General secretion pathway protein GspD n=1 Tax=Mucilaginibacter straminoryzae TaxID=2932774 RepID=A0A9X1XC08_9SPHI|nr:general secretion pathway protein GspD [Mucilaginibacter straminoryzae]MCJ8212044.1 general secretion pathway protein GspD [Mucilaginibacter straminoryzae]
MKFIRYYLIIKKFVLKNYLTFTIFLFVIFVTFSVKAQTTNPRITAIQHRLDSMARTNPGLNEKVQLSVTGVSLRDYLTAIGKLNNLSFNVDPALDFKIYNTFSNVTAANILVLLAEQNSLEISNIGSIIIVKPFKVAQPPLRPVIKVPIIKYSYGDNSLSLELNQDTLSAVAKKITQVSGKNVIVPVALQSKLISGFFAAAPFDVAMEKLAFANEVKLVKTNDNFYLFQPLEDGEQLYVNGDSKTSVRKVFKPQTSAGSGGNTGLFTRTLPTGEKVISVDATNAPIADLVKNASLQLNKNYSIYSELKGTVTIHANDLSYDNFLTMLFKSTDYTYNMDSGVYMIGDRKLEGLRVNRVIKLQNRSIDTVMAMIPAEWKKGVEVKEFREQNTLLLSGSKPQIEEIQSFVKQLDVLVPMVLIEVTLIDVHNFRTISTGISAGVADSVKTGGSVLPGIDFTFGASSINNFLNRVGGATGVNLGHVVPNFYVSLKALEDKDNIDVRSVPKLSTLNGHNATLSIGNTRYYKNVTQNVIPTTTTSQSIFSNTYQETSANLTINIKPVVSGDDQVTLNIKVDISDFTGNPPDNAPPPKSTSKFESIIRAHNEDMIVLGGIERSEGSESASGIPLLSRIPILKYIFSKRSKTTGKVVTMVFIKPTIIL